MSVLDGTSSTPAADALLRLAKALAEADDPLEIMWIVTDCVRELYTCDVASIQLRRLDGSYVLAHSAGDVSAEAREALRARQLDRSRQAILERERRVVAIEALPGAPAPGAGDRSGPGRWSSLLIPFVSREELLGYCGAHYLSGRPPFSEREIALAEGIAGQVALALDNARLRAAERQKSARLEALHAVATDMLAHRELEEVLQVVADHALELTGRSVGGVLLWDDETDGLRVVAARDPSGSFEPGSVQRGASLSLDAFRENRVLVVNELQRDPSRWESTGATELKAAIAVPLRLAGEPIGTLTVAERSEGRGFGEHDTAVLELLAGHAALAIERARLLQRERAAARLQGAIETARGLAHELNQPLSVVVGHAEILRRMSDPARPLRDAYESLEQISLAADTLTERIRLLQRIVRVETRELPGVGRYIDLQRSTAN